MRIVPLGINGFVPTFGRHTTSFLVLISRKAILLDAGTGIARLFDAGLRNAVGAFEELHIILSHYHLDHIIGLCYLPGILPGMPVFVHAPAPPLVEADPHRALTTLINPPFLSLPLQQFPMPLNLIPITGNRFDIGNLSIHVRAQTHPGGSIGIRIDDLVFMTDTIVDDNAVPFVIGANLLLHEVWLSDDEVQNNADDLAGHSFASGAVKIASDAHVRTVWPIHLHPQKTASQIETLVESMQRDKLKAICPSEGTIYDF